MEVARGGGKLNPWAEPFVPAGWSATYWRCGGVAAVEPAVAEVEDFSPEWWRLVGSSPAFRDSWLRDYSALGLLDDNDNGDGDDLEGFLLPDDLFSSTPHLVGEPADEKEGKGFGGAGGEKVKGGSAEVVAWGIDKWWRAHSSPPEVPRYADKAPRRVAAAAARVNPRPIQQPR
uniref:Ataxin-2 C-terminal domain-containing protein n=1 Tax=Oryza nivara TaxID=4536 RepID=A0A0E0HD24_ORYNI